MSAGIRWVQFLSDGQCYVSNNMLWLPTRVGGQATEWASHENTQYYTECRLHWNLPDSMSEENKQAVHVRYLFPYTIQNFCIRSQRTTGMSKIVAWQSMGGPAISCLSYRTLGRHFSRGGGGAKEQSGVNAPDPHKRTLYPRPRLPTKGSDDNRTHCQPFRDKTMMMHSVDSMVDILWWWERSRERE